MSTNAVPITVAHGDGIGPEIMDAVLRILEGANARIVPETIEIGERVYLSGDTSGISKEAWESIMRTKVFLKSPITTPQGGGYKSLNVTTRKSLGLFANVRPCRTFPFVKSKHQNMDLVIIRENEEDTYGGIEHRQTDEVYQCLKLITRPGSEKIIRYAFEYARANGRKRLTCFTKDNIMKLTDGLFHKIFDEIGAEYPEIEQEHWIIDIGSAKLADSPEVFDVIVTLNLYGDVISDIAAQIAGSVGMAAGANIGVNYAMFEAIHGSAPRRAGQNLANPSGLLNGAIMMLNHIRQADVAQCIHNAWLRTLEDGIHTYDIFVEGKSAEKVGTKEFADAVIARLGQEPRQLKPVRYDNAAEGGKSMQELYGWKRMAPANRTIAGVDVFAFHQTEDVQEIANLAQQANTAKLALQMVSNRGTKVWPTGNPETFLADHWRLRYKAEGPAASKQDIIELLVAANAAGLDFVKTEHLYDFDGEAQYSRGQGE